MNSSFLPCLPNCDQSKSSACSTDPATSKTLENISGRTANAPSTVGFWNCSSDQTSFGQTPVITPGYYCYDAANRDNDRKNAAAAAAVAALKMWPSSYDFHHHTANSMTCQNGTTSGADMYANPFAAAAHHQWSYNPYQTQQAYERSLHHSAFQVTNEKKLITWFRLIFLTFRG